MLNVRYLYRAPKVTKKKKDSNKIKTQVKPEWNFEVTDMSRYKLSNQEILQKRVMSTSKNLGYIKANKIVESTQKQIEKMMNAHRSKSVNTSFEINQGSLNARKQPSVNKKMLHEIVNPSTVISKYKIDSATPCKKISLNQSFTKSSTGRSKTNLCSLNSRPLHVEDSFNQLGNERKIRTDYGMSILGRSIQASANNSCNVSYLSQSRNSNASFSRGLSSSNQKSNLRGNSSNKENNKIVMQVNYVMKTKVTKKKVADIKSLKPKDSIETNHKEIMSLVSYDDISSGRPQDLSKQSEISEHSYAAQEDNHYQQSIHNDNEESPEVHNLKRSNFEVEPSIIRNEKSNKDASLDDCLKRLNNVLHISKNINCFNNEEDLATNPDNYGYEKADDHGIYNSSFRAQSNDDEVSQIKKSIQNDLFKYSNLISAGNDDKYIAQTSFNQSNITKPPVYHSNAMMAKNSFQSNYDFIGSSDGSQQQTPKSTSSINRIQTYETEKAKTKEISQLKELLAKTNSNIKSLASRFN